ncbi:MAG: IS1380 family transposase [Rhodospirillaceae bacterium]|nr:IS1380 family transposase [Rhodospirillales bacterium]
MVDPTLPLSGLSPVGGKSVIARFDRGELSSDAEVLALREIESRLGMAEIIRFRLLMIAAGYEDGNDSTGLRADPVFKMALDQVPSGRALCSQSTISRLENLPDKKALLRPAKRPKGLEIRAFLRRLFRAIRTNWPQTSILLRADSHYCAPEVLDWCRAEGVDYILGVAPTSTLRTHILALEASTKARFDQAPDGGKLRRFKEFLDGAASWSRVERIIARVEAGPDGTDTRFIVTSLTGGDGRALYQGIYCQRGQAENHIKSWKTHLAADRTSCHEATANQFRLFLHAGAYWLLWSLRRLMPKRSVWRVAQFDTLRLRLIKIAARVIELKTMIKVHLPTANPCQDILNLALGRLPRLVT